MSASRARWQLGIRGHPLHPVLAIFPLALLTSSVALDVASLIEHGTRFSEGARFALGAGLVAGVMASIPGILDMLSYPRGARNVPLRHGVLNGFAMALMLASWWLRPVMPAADASGTAPSALPAPPLAIALSVVALLLAVIAWRLGIRLTPAPPKLERHSTARSPESTPSNSAT